MLVLSLIGIVLSFYYLFSVIETEKNQTELPLLAVQKKESKDKEIPSNKREDRIRTKTETLLGGISIPSIDKKLKLYEEAIEPYITDGVGVDMMGRELGKDNYVLASHDYPNTFGEVKNVSVGELIYILKEQQLFTFEVIETFEADNNNVSDIKKVRENTNKPLLTLYTCLGEQNTPYRTVVQATIKDVKTVQNDDKEVIELFSVS